MSETGPRQKVSGFRPLKRLFFGLLVSYLVIVIVLAFFQRRLIYRPGRAAALHVADFAEVMQVFPASRDITLTCEDGIQIRGWLMRKSEGDSDSVGRRPLAIYFHGNAGTRASRIRWYELLDAAGMDVLAIDYHGYGDSGGKPSETGLEYDCHAAWNFATKDLGYSPEQISVVGTSLGGAAAVYLTARQCELGQPPAALVVVATFASMAEVAGRHYPWLPVDSVLVERFPSAERIQNVTSRILVVHGDADTIVHQDSGRKLFESAPDFSHDGTAPSWVNLRGVGHNDIFQGSQHQILDAMIELLEAEIVPDHAP